jgi:adenosylcobalamin-dependent ribonucleoside-triphosphate reductase
MTTRKTPARKYRSGMGKAVADRTVNRKIVRKFRKPKDIPFFFMRDDTVSLEDRMVSFAKGEGYAYEGNYKVEHGDDVAVSGTFSAVGKIEVEEWADVAERVSLGNSLLEPRVEMRETERNRLEHHLRQASVLMSGRHLQHGDETQPTRNMEVFTNCATSATSFLLFYLLLNGSGVGRAYDDAMMKVDWSEMPTTVCTIDWNHEDVKSGIINGYMTPRDAQHFYAGSAITVFNVPDSREGWAKAFEIMERMAYQGRRNDVLILDFSGVRPRGAPIKGMQNRPSSGPGPLMGALTSIARIRDARMDPWRAAMYVDHYAAECVLVGGARRAARMATKFWKDQTIFEFIELKRGGFLWSSNNSVTIDQEFRDAVNKLHPIFENLKGEILKAALQTALRAGDFTLDEVHAYKVLRAITEAAYYDQTGEPGLINQDRLNANKDGLEAYKDGLFAESARFKLDADTVDLMKDLAATAIDLNYFMITNPCGEICLLLLGGYCVIADVVPFHAKNDDDAEDSFRVATRALIRTNLMESLYSREVARTNRIGVGITGFHEWVYKRFGYTWHDIVNEEKSKPMWLMMSRFKRAIVDEATAYAIELNVTIPHTNTTFKPAGTTSKLFGLTEGAHLPSMREFIRWVQFRHDDPLVKQYEDKGFPVKHLKSYEGTTVVGFPTKPTICELDGGDWVVTAAEATPEDQYEFLRLLEKYWIVGVAEDGVTPLEDTGNQVSYTLKYNPDEVTYERFVNTLIEGQFSVRCCSVMPQSDTSAYEYQPEEMVSKLEYERIADAIQHDNDNEVEEDISFEHLDCGTGGCPVDFQEEKVAA